MDLPRSNVHVQGMANHTTSDDPLDAVALATRADHGADIPATIRYLAFAGVDPRRMPLQDGSRCPRCDGERVQKWGRFSGRQRYRCRDCGRTFSTFTGTPLHYLKRPELWRWFLWCHDGRLTVRAAGAALGVHKDTALRWRHRVRDHDRQAMASDADPDTARSALPQPPSRDPRPS